jgi:hypothetical protein
MNTDVCQLWFDLTYFSKKSAEVSQGMKNSLKKFSMPEPKPLKGATVDSGAGMTKSYAKACKIIQIWIDHAVADSCGIHDLHSDFCLPIQQYIGEGKLGLKNAVQFLHTLYSLYDELNGFKRRWNKIVRGGWHKVYGTEAGKITIDLPKDLLLATQATSPLDSLVDNRVSSHTWKQISHLFIKNDGRCSKYDKGRISDKESTLASNLLSLASLDWIIADVHFLSTIAESFLNPHMRWYQGADQNIGMLGFLAFHPLVQHCLQIEDVENIKQKWRTRKEFKMFVEYFAEMEQRIELKEQMVVVHFMGIMIKQVHKHNWWYLHTASLV